MKILSTVFAFLLTLAMTPNLLAQSRVPDIANKYPIGQEPGAFFKANGGGFVQNRDIPACNTYPKCFENFGKIWNESCMVRETQVVLTADKKLIHSILEAWSGKCNGEGDGPTVKELIGDQVPPRWIKNLEDGNYIVS